MPTKKKPRTNPLNEANQVLMLVSSPTMNLNFRLITQKEKGKLVIRAQLQSVQDLEHVWSNFADDWGHEYLPTHSLADAHAQFASMIERSLDFDISEGDWEDGDELTVDAE